MNRNQLALFYAVAQSGSFSRGAEAVRVSQPAVSRQIAQLEDSLGVRLLDRLPRGCSLTEAGTVLAGYAKRWLAVESDAARAIQELRSLKRGRIAVGASQTIGGYLLPSVFAEFHRHHPEIELTLAIANTEHVQQKLLEGEVEVGLTEGPIESDELESKVFFQDELVAIGPAGHPFLKRKRVTVSDLCHESLILREEGSGTRAVVEMALRRRGFEIKPLLSMASPEAIKNAVAAGLGLALVSRLIVGRELQTGFLKIIPVTGLRIRRPLHLQRVRGRAQSPSLLRFIEVMAAHVAGLPSGPGERQTPA